MTNLETEPVLWTPEHDYTPAEDRSLIRALRQSPGVLSYDDFRVSATTPASWNVNVGPGRAIIDGSVAPWLQGSYVCYSPSSRTIPIQPAHPTLDYIAVVILHVLDQENSTEEGFGWRREVVTGNPGTLAPPDLPPNSLPLRSYRVTAGAAALTDAMSYPPLWPWQAGTDLRRPAGAPLMHLMDTKRNVAVTATWAKPIYFDLQVPAGWGPLALWPFEVVMEVQLTLQAFFAGAGTISIAYDPRVNPGAGVTPPGRETNNISSSGAGNQWVSFQDLQRFDPGDSPQWALQIQSTGTTGTARIDATTRIWPRNARLNRASNAGLDF